MFRIITATIFGCCFVIAAGQLGDKHRFDEPIPADLEYYDDQPAGERLIRIPHNSGQQNARRQSQNSKPPTSAPRISVSVERRKQIQEEKRQSQLPKTRTEFRCPEPYGVFPDAYQCDKYYECEDDIPTFKLCDDGLVYQPLNLFNRDPCDSPYVVECGDRLDLQEPTFTSEYCPRRHGFFASPDPTICDVFYTCIKGNHVSTTCTSGLLFDDKSGTCTWPGIAKRKGCDANKNKLSLNGFKCPDGDFVNDIGVTIPHPSYPDSKDCQKFIVCLNNVAPQEASCALGKVFNERTMLCDYPENVPECYDWYKDDPRFADYYYDDETGRSDIGAVDVV